jgi:dUTP pyrophosphatase
MSKLSKAIANAIIEFNAGLLTQDELYQKLEQDIDDVSVKVWREDKSVPLPTYGREGDACCDVYAKSIEYDSDKDRFIIHTGLHFALPDEYEMELRPRSSNTKTDFYMPNSPGTLDWGYRGELRVIFKNRTSRQLIRIISTFGNAFNDIVTRVKNENAYNSIMCARQEFNKLIKKEGCPYVKGDRVCQLLVRRREKITWDEVETLEELGTTERGTCGFGSTGK